MIKKATIKEYDIVANLAKELWPSHDIQSLEEEYVKLLNKEKVAIFCYYVDGSAVAFAQCDLRFDYVEGAKTNPVGYLEGIYVKANFRKKEIARSLLLACENWAREQGCTEFASDCELDNNLSYNFHIKYGFKEVNRIICFTKDL